MGSNTREARAPPGQSASRPHRRSAHAPGVASDPHAAARSRSGPARASRPGCREGTPSRRTGPVGGAAEIRPAGRRRRRPDAPIVSDSCSMRPALRRLSGSAAIRASEPPGAAVTRVARSCRSRWARCAAMANGSPGAIGASMPAPVRRWLVSGSGSAARGARARRWGRHCRVIRPRDRWRRG